VAAVENETQMLAVFEEIEERYGGLAVLVNNAGIAGPTAGIENMDLEEWKSCLAVNLDGAMLATRGAVPLMQRQSGGCIVNISSTGGLFGYPDRSPYAAAKWGLIGLTKTWAMELGARGIRVNAVCPGSVEGPRIDVVIARDARERGVDEKTMREVYQRQTSMRCFVGAEEIADVAVFLASDKARHISGQVIAVDGHTEGLGKPFD
jgi:NAD(P)-dependent dehydrogenase (short-subunit alcohol dehydrogenase family)